jgi:hypothetical protein
MLSRLVYWISVDDKYDVRFPHAHTQILMTGRRAHDGEWL